MGEVFNRLNYYKRIFNAYIFKKSSSNLSFWHTDLKANELSEEDRSTVRLYPMNFAEKTRYDKHRDSDGVIMLDYGSDLGVQYNPNAIAQVSLGFYDLYLGSLVSKDNRLQDLYVDSFLKQSNWFINHGRKVRDNVLLWEYNFPFEMREYLKKPWRSALAQGQAISVLIRAFILTKDNKYLSAAHDGFNAFRYSGLQHEGGVVYRDKDNVWLEEVIFSKPNHILNGLVWALWGVRDYAVFVKDDYATQLYMETEMTLSRILDRYDLGFWTCYDDISCIKGPIMPVSSYYQKLHTIQMLAMYQLTQKEIYYEKYKKWLSYYNNYFYRKLTFCWKCYFKLRYW